jgi:hypothetical protein
MYEVFEITSDAKWTPRRYLEDDPGGSTKDVLVTNQDLEDFQDALQDVPQVIEEYMTLDDISMLSMHSCYGKETTE